MSLENFSRQLHFQAEPSRKMPGIRPRLGRGHPENKLPICSTCNFTCKDYRTLRKHCETVHRSASTYRAECDICHITFACSLNMKKHMRNVHYRLYDKFCTICDFSHYDHYALRYHFEKFHSETPKSKIECYRCDAVFTTVPNLKRHIKFVHEKAPRKYYMSFCQYCDYSTMNKKHLKKHVSLSHMKRYVCGWCEFYSEDNNEVKQHEGREHRDRHTFCPFCSFFAPKNHEVMEHVQRNHDKVYNLRCKFCDLSFIRGNELDIHIKGKHDLVTNFKCLECKYKTYTKKHLNAHLKCSGHSEVASTTED